MYHFVVHRNLLGALGMHSRNMGRVETTFDASSDLYRRRHDIQTRYAPEASRVVACTIALSSEVDARGEDAMYQHGVDCPAESRPYLHTIILGIARPS